MMLLGKINLNYLHKEKFSSMSFGLIKSSNATSCLGGLLLGLHVITCNDVSASNVPFQINISAGSEITSDLNEDPNNPGRAVEKTGLGDFISVNTLYAGTTTITEGRWFAMGPLGSTGTAISIASGATFGGTGLVTGVIQNNGILAPSAGGVNEGDEVIPIGTTMNISGSLTQTSTGETLLYFTPTAGDKVAVTGAVNLGLGTIQITPTPGFYNPQSPPTFTAFTWGSNAGATPTVVVTTANPSQQNYIPLNVTTNITSTGLTVSFAGINTTLTASQTADASVFAAITGAVTVPNGVVLSSTANTSSAIPNTLAFTGASASITPAANSTLNFSGQITGSSASMVTIAGVDSSSVVAFNGNSPGYTGTLNASNVSLIVNGTLGATVNAGSGTVLSGTGTMGDVTAVGATIKPAGSNGTLNFTGLNTSSTHYQVEMNSAGGGQINVAGDIALGSDVTVDVLMDADTYSTYYKYYRIFTASGALTGNVTTLTWAPQTGLIFDLKTAPSGKSMSLISIVGSSFTIGANQTTAGTVARRFIASGTTMAPTDLAPYNYITLLGGTISNASGMQTLTQPISLQGVSTLNTSVGSTTELTGALTSSAGTLILSGGGTTILPMDMSRSAAGISVNSSLVNVRAGSSFSSGGSLALNNSTVTFLGTSGDTTTLTGATTISGMANIIANAGVVNVNGAVTGSGVMNVSGGGIVGFNADNTGLNGTVNVNATKISLGAGANLGSSAVTLSNGSGLILDTVTLPNAITLADASTVSINAGKTATLSGALSGAGMTVSSAANNIGSLLIQGYNPAYTGAINASNINLVVNGAVGSAITVDSNTILSGAGSVGDVTLQNGSLVSPGNVATGEIGAINATNLTVQSGAHFCVQINANGQASHINVSGITNMATSFTVDVLMGAGTYPVGSVNYPIIITGNSADLIGYADTLVWTTHDGLTFDVGLSADGTSLILQSTVTTSPLVIGANQTTLGASSTLSISSHTIEAVNQTPTNVNTSIAINTLTSLLPNSPVNLNNATITNTSGSHTLTAALAVTTGTSTLNTNSGAETVITKPITSAPNTILNFDGGGTTTIFGDNDATLQGRVAVTNSTVNVGAGSNLGMGALALTGATVNLTAGASLNNAVTTDGHTTIQLQSSGVPVVVNGSLSGAGTVNVSGGGTALFTGINTGLAGPVNVTGSTVQIANNSNLGTGTLSVNSGTISMGTVALPNPISVTAASTFTSNAASGTTSTLSGAITGSAPLTFNGTGKTNLTATGASAYTGTLNVTGGTLAINSVMPETRVNVASGATLSGVGTIGGLTQYGAMKPGNSIGTFTIDGNYTTVDGAIYNVEINSAQPSVADALAPRSSQIVVTGNTTLSDTYTINVLMDAGFYPAGVVDYAILTSAGTLDVNAINLQWNTQPGLTFTVGTLADSGTDGDGHSLMLRYIATQGFTVGSDQTAVDTTTLGVTYNSTAFDNPTLTPSTNDVFATNSGLAPVADHPEFTDIVFQNNQPAGSDGSSDDDVTTTATTDNFRFKGFKSKKPTASVGKKGALESLLNAISENGPVSYQKNETRIWMAPYANRSRTSMTNSNVGNQGWSGGSLMGIEQRNAKDTWSIGLITGLMGSRSHVLGQPNTFSKTKGVLFGMSNMYKYTDYKDAGNFGHEIFASRVTTFVDSQRYGLSTVDNTTPFYALASYKTTTDIMNAQLNYLFNVIPKSVTCRLNLGATYHDVKTGKIDERNAGVNGITTAASSAQSTQVYGGIGLRKSLKYDAIAIRTTAVYEYGYQVSSTGSPIVKTTQSAAPTTFTDTVGPRQNKHYVQLNSSYADKDSGLKFSLSYSGVFYKNVATHTGMLKVAYQF